MPSEIDRREFDAEITKHYRTLKAAARGLCSKQPNAAVLAEDLLQDATIRALECRDQFCGASVVGWLYAILRNVYRDHLRSQGRTRKRETLHADMGSDDASRHESFADLSNPHTTLEASQVVEAISRLPARAASALLQVSVGATSAEIAATFGASEANARKLLARSRLALRDLLETPKLADGKAA